MNNKGKMIATMPYEGIDELSEGLIRLNKDGKQGFIDITGKTIIPLKYNVALDFQEGFAPVGMKVEEGYAGDKWGFIDKTGGKLPLDKQNLASLDFEGGLVKVLQFGGSYVYLDETGKEIYPPSPDIGNFSEGLAAVRQGMKYGFIDRIGQGR